MIDRLRAVWCAPQPILRLALVRILCPLAMLLFLRPYLVHADVWIGDGAFLVPDLGGKAHGQPLYLPLLPTALAWIVVVIAVLSGLLTSAGAFTRFAAPVFAICLAYFALADRLTAYTVNKLGTAIVIALALTPCAAACSIDAILRRRRDPTFTTPTQVSWGPVRFFQSLLVVFYCASGVAKLYGHWLTDDDVLWSHLHDAYQTPFAAVLVDALPPWAWPVLQRVVLAFETLAPLWFTLPWTRIPAVVVGIAMHAFIAAMFGPLAWFSLLMISLLVACFAPLPARTAADPMRSSADRPT
jgi:hypothetical protein